MREGLDILPYSFLLSSKLRYATTLVVHVEGQTCLRAEYFTLHYIALGIKGNEKADLEQYQRKGQR